MTDAMMTPQIGLDPAALLADLNPEQAAAVTAPVTAAVQVMAGAGTGKTKLITHRFVKLALDLKQAQSGDPTHRLWVSTFTEKAATELKDRIGRYLAQTTGEPLHPQAWIGTFHSLCQRILRQHAEKVPHLSHASLLTELELDLLKERLVQMILDQDISLVPATQGPWSPDCLTADSLMELDVGDFEQLFTEIVQNTIPRLKAAGLTPQAFHQQATQQAEAFTQLLMTLPTSAPYSGELWQDVTCYAQHWQHQLAPISHGSRGFSPNPWRLEIEALKAQRKGEKPPDETKLLTETIKPIFKTNLLVSYNGRSRKAPFLPRTGDLNLLDRQLYLEKALIDVVASVYDLYQQMLRLERVCDFDDLIHETLTLLNTTPQVAQAYRKHFAHFMVDEFQDSNGSQLALMQALAGSTAPPITVVGDKKQSIYGFRFAEPENLHLLFQQVPEVVRIPLQTNYRCHPDILALANRVTEMMSLSEPEMLTSGITPANSDSAAVTWLHLEDTPPIHEAKAQESAWICETIAQLLVQGEYAPSQIAILVRNHAKAQALETALEAWHIPAIRQKNLGFFQAPVIRQAVALLEAAYRPQNDFALITVLQDVLSDAQLYQLSLSRQALAKQTYPEPASYTETLRHFEYFPDQIPDSLGNIWPWLQYVYHFVQDHYYRSQSLTPANWIRQVLDGFAGFSLLSGDARAQVKARHQLELLKMTLYHWAQRPSHPLTLDELMTLLKQAQGKNELELPVDAPGFSEDSVRILSVHGAKGLEFPVVFLAGVDKYMASRSSQIMTVDPQYRGKQGVGLLLNKFQDEKSLKKIVYDTLWHKPRAEDEELRLFYVGITRAKEKLFLSSCQQSFPYCNPALFRGLAITPAEPHTLEISEIEPLKEQLSQRFPASGPSDEAAPEPVESQGNQSSLSPLSPKPQASAPILWLESLLAFQQCTVAGILTHRYPNLAGLSTIASDRAFVRIEGVGWLGVNIGNSLEHVFPETATLREVAVNLATILAAGPELPAREPNPPCKSCACQSFCPVQPVSDS